VEKKPKTEEQLKGQIFENYSKCREELSSERRQVYIGQLGDLIFRWCKDYRFTKVDIDEETGTDYPVKQANNMGEEIFITARGLVKNIAIVPKDKNGFFGYLTNALRNAQKQTKRKKVVGPIHIPRDFKGISFNNIKEVLSISESNIGKKLTVNECAYYLSEWYGWDEKESRECLEIMNRRFMGSSSSNYDDDSSPDTPDIPDISNDPLIELLANENKQKICDAVESILQEEEEYRDIYRALFTQYCIKEVANYEDLLMVLDNEIIEAFKTEEKIPTRGEIIMKYNKVISTKESADSTAAKLLKRFNKKLEDHINKLESDKQS
jgi:hypothetical protein